MFISAAFRVVELYDHLANPNQYYPNAYDNMMPKNINRNEKPVLRYFVLHQEIQKQTNATLSNSETAYNRATVVEEASWFQAQEICKSTCCAKRVAISLDQDSSQLINTMDGLDLADVVFRNNPGPNHLKFHANVFHEQMLPCFQQGTIIHLNNNWKIVKYFWRKVRRSIKVPFVLITSDSDNNSPIEWGERLEDPLLLKWYGMNPKYNNESRFQEHLYKFEPFSLGLSMNHQQAKYLTKYLELTNFSNPFLDKNRWTSRKQINWKEDILVNFGRRREHRKQMWKILCPDSNSTHGISCNHDHFVPSEIYASASKFRFGISPPGAGWDCYRTYEWLMLGVIPVIEERYPEGQQLFEGLPVIHMPNMRKASTRQDFQHAIENYLKSDIFQKSSFDGWHKLFLKYWRRKMLAHAGKDIVQDEHGREFYTTWRYTSKSKEEVYCSKPRNCVAR